MSRLRVAWRWILTLLALGLVLVALLLGGLRLAVEHVDALQGPLNTQLQQRFGVRLNLGSLAGSVHGLDPALKIDALRLRSHVQGDAVPLLEIDHARLRLDASASLRAGGPVIVAARASDVTLHLYQDARGRWRWPGTDELPDTDVDPGDIDAIMALLWRQRAVVEKLRLVLHGVDDRVTLVVPRLLLAGGDADAQLEGELFVAGQSKQAAKVVATKRAATEADEADADLQIDADMGALAPLGPLLTRQQALHLQTLDGDVRLQGRWRQGRLMDARAAVRIASMTLADDTASTTLDTLGARAEWRRGKANAWQAWVNTSDTAGDDEAAERPWPQNLHLQGEGDDWQLRASDFDLGALAETLQRLPLPNTLDEPLTGLAPRGRVTGLSVTHREGDWHLQGAVQGAVIAAWHNVPGLGPLDAWVEGSPGRGQVHFAHRDGMQLIFPRVFAEPIVPSRATGRLDWQWQDGDWQLAGNDLSLGWRGAEVDGGFRLRRPAEAPGEFALSLAMQNVNAIDTPLMNWLPERVLGDELRQWLALGAAGRVPQGRFHLSLPLDHDDGNDKDDTALAAKDDDDFDGKLRLALRIVDGRFAYAPDWPALTAVAGELELHDETLKATIDHAETQGLVSEGGTVAYADDRLTVQAPIQGASQALLGFLAASPLDGAAELGTWRSQGDIAADMTLTLPVDDPDALTLDVQSQVAISRLTLPRSDLALHAINGDLHYRHADERDTATGTLGARVFEGPMLAKVDIGGQGVALEGRALARGLLDWGGLSGLKGLIKGYFPYSAQLTLGDEAPRLTLNSSLEGLGIKLPAPFGKRPGERVPLAMAVVPGERTTLEIADRLRLRWRQTAGGEQGQAWLAQWPEAPRWPAGPGWEVLWRSPALPVEPWQQALASLDLPETPGSADGETAGPGLRRLQLDTDCLRLKQRCLGSLTADLRPLTQGWQFDLAGTLVSGHGSYQPDQPRPLSLQLAQLHLDALASDAPVASPTLADEIATPPDPEPFPAALGELPDGEIAIDTLWHKGRRLGPVSARWASTAQHLRIAPLAFTLGQVEGQGELSWEAAGERESLTRASLGLTGGDLGTAFEAFGQPVPLRSRQTQVDARLAWPGAPWQFALRRSNGDIEATLEDGRFLTLDSSSAKLVGLLNVDNLLRRLRLDFSDVTGKGTAFDSVHGAATLYEGRLETRGPIEIDGSSTQFSLDGNVNLLRRELDLALGITVPISQNLPLAAVLIGAPYVGGALFLADRFFGGWIDKVTRIYYRVQGPWASPRITLENAE